MRIRKIQPRIPGENGKKETPWKYPITWIGDPPPRMPVANEGLGWDSLLKMVHNPGGDDCILGRGTTQPINHLPSSVLIDVPISSPQGHRVLHGARRLSNEDSRVLWLVSSPVAFIRIHQGMISTSRGFFWNFMHHTVDGSEIRRSPVEVGSLSHYLQGFIHASWCRISSINSTTRREVVAKIVKSFEKGLQIQPQTQGIRGWSETQL